MSRRERISYSEFNPRPEGPAEVSYSTAILDGRRFRGASTDPPYYVECHFAVSGFITDDNQRIETDEVTEGVNPQLHVWADPGWVLWSDFPEDAIKRISEENCAAGRRRHQVYSRER